MRKLCYLVVEGPHDVEFSCRIIKSKTNLTRIRMVDELDEVLRSLVPDKFPHGGDLLKRVPVPVFFQNETSAVAVHAAGGDSKIANCIAGTLDIITADQFSAIGVVLDSDSDKSPAERHRNLIELTKDLPVKFPETPGNVLKGSPSSGVFVLPDNSSMGTLEDLLIECGKAVYPGQIYKAETFVADAFSICPSKDFKDLHSPSGRNKAIVGSVAGLLRPGKAVQVSIQDNAWLSDLGLQIPRVGAFADFLVELFEFNTTTVIAPTTASPTP
jgi:hypothetical protein